MIYSYIIDKMNTKTQTKNINPKTVARLVTKMKLTN